MPPNNILINIQHYILVGLLDEGESILIGFEEFVCVKFLGLTLDWFGDFYFRKLRLLDWHHLGPQEHHTTQQPNHSIHIIFKNFCLGIRNKFLYYAHNNFVGSNYGI